MRRLLLASAILIGVLVLLFSFGSKETPPAPEEPLQPIAVARADPPRTLLPHGEDVEEDEPADATQLASISGRIIGPVGDGLEGVSIHLIRSRGRPVRRALAEGTAGGGLPPCYGCDHENFIQLCLHDPETAGRLGRAMAQLEAPPSGETVASGAGGSFEFHRVKNARYLVWAEPAELAPVAVAVKVSGANQQVELVAKAASSLQARVIELGTERAVIGAKVSVIDAELGIARSATSDRGGRVEVRGVAPDRVAVVFVEAGGFAPKAFYAPVSEQDRRFMEFATERGSEGNALFKWGPGEHVIAIERSGRIAGKVVRNKKPVAGESVRLDEIDTAVTDATGHFAIEDVSPGEHDVGVEVGDAAGGEQVFVQSGKTTNMKIVLRDLCKVRVLVVDEKGTPLPQVRMDDPDMIEETDEKGIFEFEAFERELPYQLHISEDGWEGSIEIAKCVPHARLVAKETQGVRGVVRDQRGDPIAGAKIEIVRPKGGAVYERISAADGTFHHGLRSGKWRLTAEKEGFLPAKLRFERPKGGEANVDVVLEDALSLRGRVIDHAGRPLVGWKVSARSWFGGFDRLEPKPTTTDGDGRFDLRGVDREEYEVEATDGDAELDAREWSVAKGELTLQLGALGSISGRVTFAQGKKPPTEFVMCMPRCIHFDAAKGTYHFPSAPAGRRQVGVSARGFTESEAVIVDIPVGGSVVADVLMVPAQDLKVRIVDAASRRPIAEAQVNLRRAQDPPYWPGNERITDERGELLLADLDVGEFRLDVVSKGLPPKSVLFNTGDALPNPFVVALDAGVTVSGVVEAPPDCLTSVSIQSTSAVDPSMSTEGTVRAGRFSVTAGGPGTYSLWFSCNREPSSISFGRTIEVPEGGLSDVAVTMPRGSAVVEVDHPPDRFGTFLSLTSKGEPRSSHVASTDEGDTHSTFDLLLPGTYSLELSYGMNDRTQREVVVGEGHQVVDLRQP